MSHESTDRTPSVTATVIDPAGPALTTTVRFPGLDGTFVDDGIDVDGVTLVVGALLVDTLVVVGAVLVDGLTDVDGLEDVDGVDDVEGDSDEPGETEDVVAAAADSTGALAATAAVNPAQSPTAAMTMMVLRRNILGDLLVGTPICISPP